MSTENLDKALIKRFISYYKPHKKLFFIDMACSLSSAMLGLFFPLITKRIMDVAIPDNNMTELVFLASILVGIYLAIAGFTYFINYWGHMVGVRIEADIREDLFAHLQKLSFKYYDNNRTGQIMSKILNDLFDITELAHHGPEDLFISVILFLGSAGILWTVEWRLTVCILIMLPIIMWFTITKRRKMRRAFADVRVKIADVNSQVENSISGIRVVQSFTNESYENMRFQEGNALFKESKKASYNAMATFMSGMGFLTNFSNGLVLVVGGLCVMHETMSMSDLVLFLLYINIILQPVQRLTNFTQQFEQGMSGFRRFAEIMDTEVDIVDSTNGIALDKVEGNIEFHNVSFHYNEEEEVLNHISLTIDAGKTVALVGPSGGGKTTLCQLIPRFYDCLEGHITLDGTDLREIKLSSLRNAVGMVQQDIFLFTGTIRENIKYGKIDATEEEVIQAAKQARVHDFIMSCPNGYDTNIGEKGVRLSGGQKQRMSIARAFLKNPPILILDEATSALDNQTEQEVQQSLNELSQGRTTLVIAHRLSTIKNADVIIVLSGDGVEESGNHTELYAKNGIYTKLYDAQFKLDQEG
ncbi:MAG: ABC transporter ATP-binding protein [Eubacteriales bacterium]